jgi:hypothetical protein
MIRTILGRFTFPPVCAEAAEEADMAAETPVSHSLRVDPEDGSDWTAITAVSRIGRLGRTRRSVTIAIFLGQVTRCVAVVLVHAELQGLDALDEKERVERAEARVEIAQAFDARLDPAVLLQRNRRHSSRVSRNCSEIRGLPVQLKQETLNRLYLVLLEIRLTALAAYPGRDCF